MTPNPIWAILPSISTDTRAPARLTVVPYDMLTVVAASKLTGLPVRTLRRWCARWAATGTVRVRVERRRGNARGTYLVDEASLTAWMEAA